MSIPHQLWRSPAGDMTLDNDEVHVWSACLDQPVARVRRLAELCSPEERARAERFRFQQDQERFLVRRGILRTILSRYGAGAPREQQFTRTLNGKPAVEPLPDQPPIQFNTSHSHALFLCAVARNARVGVDVEYMRPMPDAERVAARFFAPGEFAAWRGLSNQDRVEGFYVCWTRKEAYIKATGEGLARPLDSFEVSLRPGESARLLHDAHDPENVSRYGLYDLRPAAGYIGALAVECSHYSIKCRQWAE
ncbi:MAG TPA: 4'-phosphopantetheinyl transferase superfamily protein [Herpetosiphonaceae bacterium]|nr:4'-phosphopantetheinyl transferase superfamily protein [Herpetosiphonaceae bacterium]